MSTIALYRALVAAKVDEKLASEAVTEIVTEQNQQNITPDIADINADIVREFKYIRWTQYFLIAGIIAILAKLFIG